MREPTTRQVYMLNVMKVSPRKGVGYLGISYMCCEG